MRDNQFLNKAPSTPSAGAEAATGPVTLPPELLADASRRLGWLGLIYSFTYTVAYWGPHLVARVSTADHGYLLAQHVAATLSILTGLAVFAVARSARFAPQQMLDLGLVFAVVGALGISVAEFAPGFLVAPQSMGAYLGVPWECVWIILFPLVAPNTPNKILVASIGSALTGPIVLAVVAQAGGVDLHAPLWRLTTYFLFTTGTCAALAFVIAKVILRYGLRLKKAREVGSYELVSAIGSGGMGEVWIARHRMLARPAAIKLIRPELLGAEPRAREVASRRFEREAQATAALGSKHTVDLYDFGITETGAFYYAMELLNGVTLEALVTRYGPVSPARAVYLLRQACHSLDEAHTAGLIHRDVKPANIFTCRLGPDFDFVKVLDFGLVKHHRDVNLSTDLTADGITAGTPAYMAPEMALGRDIDGRADIYALGCVAYWLLSGRQVFEADTPMATILKHVQEPAPPLSERTEMAIPAKLEAVIMSCLAKDPADRPQTASELSLRLQANLCGDPWTSYDAREWWQLHNPTADRHPDQHRAPSTEHRAPST